MSRVVSDLVIEAASAAGEAIAVHLARLVGSQTKETRIEDLAAALDHGYDLDFDELTHPRQPIGYDHALISQIYRSRLSPLFPNRQKGYHVSEMDEEREVFSLFGRTQAAEPWKPARRTRASALTQKLMRECRHFRQAEKNTTAAEPSRMVTVPSPLNIASILLGDPRSAASQTYSRAALVEWMREQIGQSREIDLSFAGISEALGTINNRWKTSKPIISDARQNGPTVLFLCNLFAIQGLMAMRVDLGHFARLGDALLNASAVTAMESRAQLDGAVLEALTGMTEKAVKAEFIVNSQCAELPGTGAVLNMVDGVPVPLEGGNLIFEGGIRLSPEKSIVAAISGPFGAGKTLLGLSLAASFAPLGCRTLFLSCEESQEDLQSRLIEAAPRALFRATPLFRALNEDDFQLSRFEKKRAGSNPDGEGQVEVPWFMARHLSLDVDPNIDADPAAALERMLIQTIEKADIFRPYQSVNADVRLPHFARPLVIIDGLHQLFDLPQRNKVVESSLRRLISTCRQLGAYFIFSFSSEARDLKRLEYLCDLIVELDREGYEDPAQKPRRIFKLLKARRQPARIGAHIFHLKGDAGFRLKPSVDARAQAAKQELWSGPDDRAEIYLTDEAPTGFRQTDPNSLLNKFSIQNQSQVLVVGKGSSGKAGFGLYLLHRRAFDRRMLVDDDQPNLPMGEPTWVIPESRLSARKKAIRDARLPVRFDAKFLETRVLVVSFLYQRAYYDDLTARITAKRRGKPDRKEIQYGRIDQPELAEFMPLPDRARTDTIELYPGMLGPEDFIAKVEKKLLVAEEMGVPYTGILVDGLHNVFVQYPGLEGESAFWGMFYNILRRRRVTVVTTHTEFDIQDSPTGRVESVSAPHSMLYNFDQAQRKIAPLLSALISGADYLFELSSVDEAHRTIYKVVPKSALGGIEYGLSYSWDKVRLDELPREHLEFVLPPKSRRSKVETDLSDQIVKIIGEIARSSMS